MKRPSRLPAAIVRRLKREAEEWDSRASSERPKDLLDQIARADVFHVRRPAREPVSVRLDPGDVFLLRRIARQKGIPHSQLLSQWVHERVAQEVDVPRRRVSER